MGITIKNIYLPNQVKLPYIEQGNPSGLSVILLHGYADSWRSFERVLPYLPVSIHTFAITQRGHGDASRPASGYRIHDFVSDLEAFLKAIHIKAAVIAGGSSGGFIARRFAIDHPQHTLGLVLISSPLTLGDKPSVMDLWNSTISKLTDPIDPGFVREFTESTVAQSVPKEFIDTLVNESLKVPARVWKETFKGLLEDDSFKELDRIKAPTLVIWGNKDSTVSRNDQETFVSKIEDSRLVIYPSAGHALYCEEPAQFASDITTFVEDLVR